VGAFLNKTPQKSTPSPKSAQRSPEPSPGAPKATKMKPRDTKMTPRVLQNGSKMNATNRTTKKKHLQFQNKKQCGERHGGGSSRSELDIFHQIQQE